MNNNTLIAGFEDIMTHIKNQEIRIKKLEEENKKLKDTTAWEDYEQILKDAAQKKIDSLKEENKKLEEQMGWQYSSLLLINHALFH